MRVWSSIFNVFAVLMMCGLLVVFYNVDRVMQLDFDTIRLEKAVDYAAEGAFISTLDVDDIDVEYLDLGGVKLNPGNSMDIFTELICLNYNMSISDANKAHIESFIPSAVLAGTDGYYIANMSRVYNNPEVGSDGTIENRYKWSIKKPYVIQREGENIAYSVDMLNNNWNSVEILGDTAKISYGDKLEEIGVTREDIKIAINTQISRDMLYHIKELNKHKEEWDYKFYLPITQTKTGVNPIEKPSLLVFLQGTDFASIEKLDSAAVSGLSTERKRFVLSFSEGGKKWYCFEGQLPPEKQGNVTGIYSTIEEAARAGYMPYYTYLQLPKSTYDD